MGPQRHVLSDQCRGQRRNRYFTRKRSAETEGRNIVVDVSGDKVTLTGKVNSLSEIEDARIAAWNAPGVMTVASKLEIAH